MNRLKKYKPLTAQDEMIHDAARRESLRRMSEIMHRLNGPTGRIVVALEDLIKFLDANTAIAESVVPDEKTVRRRLTTGRKKREDYTVKSRI